MDYHYFGDKGRAEGLLVAAVHVEADKLYAGFCMTPVGKCYVQGFAQSVAKYRLAFARTGAWDTDKYADLIHRYVDRRPDMSRACLTIDDFATPDYSVVLDLPEDAHDWIGHKVVLLEYLCRSGNPLAPSIRKFVRELWLEASARRDHNESLPDDLDAFSNPAAFAVDLEGRL